MGVDLSSPSLAGLIRRGQASDGGVWGAWPATQVVDGWAWCVLGVWMGSWDRWPIGLNKIKPKDWNCHKIHPEYTPTIWWTILCRSWIYKFILMDICTPASWDSTTPNAPAPATAAELWSRSPLAPGQGYAAVRGLSPDVMGGVITQRHGGFTHKPPSPHH